MMSATSLPLILFIGVNPTDTRRLRLDDEAKRIKQALRDRKDQLTFVSEGAVTADALRQHLLDHNPRVVHMSGHAVTEGFKFENPQGATALIRTDSLVDLFKLCGASIQCVVLNACLSADLAEALCPYIPYVIGMREQIGDEAALEFTSGFYDALARDYTYKDAFFIGRNAIDLKDIPESLCPVLKYRPETRELRLFEGTRADLLLTQYRQFVLRDLAVPGEGANFLPRVPVLVPLSLRVNTSSLPRPDSWPYSETLTEESLIILCHEAVGKKGTQLIISGEPGVGKTLLLQRVAAKLAQRTSGPLPLYLPIGSILKAEVFVTRWMEHRMRPANPYADGLSQVLLDRGAAGQLIVLVDGIDSLGGELRRNALIAVSSMIQFWPHAVFLLAARPYTTIGIDGSHFIRAEIQPLSRDQQVRLLSAQLGQTLSAERATTERIDEILLEIVQNPSLRDLAGTCLGLTIIAPLCAHREALARGPLLLIEQFIRLLLEGRPPSLGQGFPHPEATLSALRLLAFKLTSRARDTGSIEQLEQFLYETDAAQVRQQLEQYTPWREGGVRAFLREQADKLGILGPYDKSPQDAKPRWRFAHDAFCDALAASELKSRCSQAAGWEQVASLVDRSRETASSWFEAATLLVADAVQPDDLAKQLTEANPALGMRLLQRVPHLSAPTIFDLLGAGGDWQHRRQVFARLGKQLGNMRKAIELLDRIRCNTRDGNDLFFIDQAFADIAKECPALASPVADCRREIFAHIPRPQCPLTFETSTGRMPLFAVIPPGEVVRAPGSLFPRIIGLRAVHEYQLSRVPIPHELFAAFDPAHGPPTWRPNHPAISITWYEATMFCRWLGSLDALWAGARLPHETEWEYACLHGASGQCYCCGEAAALRRVAWYRENSVGQLRPVARLQPSPLGLYDLHGNVREWCLDLWEPASGNQRTVADVDPRADLCHTAGDDFKALRGGCYLDAADALCVGARAQSAPGLRSELFGFRVLIPRGLPSQPTEPSAAEQIESLVRIKT